ncbi:MAG: cupredoxin domain-containing protein [Polyangiaceae bacterium]
MKVAAGIVTASVLSVSVALLACKGGDGAASAAPAPSGAATAEPALDPNARIIDITASDKGFEPRSVDAKVGESIVLRFTRKTETECVKAIDFPSLEIKKDLPLNTPVNVPIKADAAGEIKYQCWMAMLFGKVVVQ